ncbi:hypothetical protein ACFWN2_12690 [Lentzea sp. NPDC058436]|uniref:hypothetical protein n=1 Tax=Lentzea sp. NPDC058436 TaxID=3346499 RepID=UPI003660994F
MAGGFKTEAENLDSAANQALAPLAGELSAARAQLAATGEFDEAFSAGQGSLCEPALASWQEARGYLERVFEDNAETLGLAAKALREIASRYREADTQSANAMNTIAREGLS